MTPLATDLTYLLQFFKKHKIEKEDKKEENYGLKIKGKVSIHDTFFDHIHQQLAWKPRMFGLSVDETFEVKMDSKLSDIAF